MTTRGDVNRLSVAQRRLVQLAQSDLVRLFDGLDLTRPAVVRNALLEVVPTLVREYGDLAAVAAAEWYESVHPGVFLARTADGVSAAQVQGSVRYAAGNLWDSEQPIFEEGADGIARVVGARTVPADPSKTLAVISGAMQRFITYSGRQTVARNVQIDPARPRFGRVPTGPKTCAFCSMLASRGFVYYTKASAGAFDHWHDDCDCQIVVEHDAEAHHIEGYDPDHLYDMYMAARQATGDVSDENVILSAMREMFPDDFKDGHVH